MLRYVGPTVTASDALVPKSYVDALIAQIPVVLCFTGTTNTAGNVSIQIPANTMTSIYGVTAQVIRNTIDPTQATFVAVRSYIAPTSVATGAVTLQVFESKTSGVVLGGSVEGCEVTATAGVQVQVIVVGARP